MNWLLHSAGLLSVGAALATPTQAQDAKTIVERMVAAYRTAPRLHVRARLKAQPEFQALWKGVESFELRVERPGRLLLTSWRREGGGSVRLAVACDGRTLWTIDPRSSRAVSSRAPARIEQISLDEVGLPELEMLLHGRSPLEGLSPGDPPAPPALAAPARAAGADCHVLELKGASPDGPASMTCRIYVGQQDYLIRGIVVEAAGKTPGDARDLQVRFEVAYDMVTTTPAFAPDAFRLPLPPSASPKPAGAKPPASPRTPRSAPHAG